MIFNLLKNIFIRLQSPSPLGKVGMGLLFLTVTLVHSNCLAQTGAQIIDKVNHNFAKVNDYTADMNIHLDISFIKMKDITAKVFFKKPKKFKVKAEGIVVLPKQNPNYMMAMLLDTNSYSAIKTGTEIINGITTTIISVIPSADTADLILGKFWVDASRGLILKSHLTTKSNGTLEIEHFYGSNSSYALPDKLIFTIETAKFKLPKALVADLSSNSTDDSDKPESKKGKITILFSNYLVNKGIDDKIFK